MEHAELVLPIPSITNSKEDAIASMAILSAVECVSQKPDHPLLLPNYPTNPDPV